MVRSTQRAILVLQVSHRTRSRLDPLSSQRRHFHDYFVTHLPSSSLHPDSRASAGPRHQLPRSASKPHIPRSTDDPAPAPVQGVNRDTTVVRIPLKSAKHHFGVSVSRGQRPYNEDTYQAGVIDLPAFSKRNPLSVTSRAPKSSPLQAYREKQQKAREETANNGTSTDGEGTAAGGAGGDPQVFYFGVYDGHGGSECSDFLKTTLHRYIEEAATDFELKSTLKKAVQGGHSIASQRETQSPKVDEQDQKLKTPGADDLPGGEKQDFYKTSQTKVAKPPPTGKVDDVPAVGNTEPVTDENVNTKRALELEKSLVSGWKDLVGGYFRRFKPKLFSKSEDAFADISTVLTYAFLRADFDFVRAQARKADDDADPVLSDGPLNASEVLDGSSLQQIGGPKRFKGGSTCSVAMISTPTPVPFWNPATPAAIVVAHVGDSRIILCRTSDGQAVPGTTNHHPSNPEEGRRLRRYAGNIVTDSFGEERMSGLANTRAFGDMQSKRIGVSAEPEIRRIEMAPAEYSFLLLVSDGISGTISDQEAVDIVKEAKTPEQGAKDIVSFATQISSDGDNATCICIRLGGWERRSEGGLGSLGTREARDYRRQEANDPRRNR